MNPIKKLFYDLRDSFDVPLTKVGDTYITLWSVIYLLILFFLLVFITAKLRKWIVYNLLSKSRIDIGVRIAVGSIIRYIVLVIGFIIIMQTVGIDFSSVTIIAGALGVGIGFGLQNVTNNFVSGIIILFERPIKVGDRIEVGEVRGDVVNIRMRSTTVLTNDNISIIVPNSEFISSKVINWSFADRNVRLNYPVRVAYKEDPFKIRDLLLEVVKENEYVLKNPKPDVLFDDFGDNSLHFNLRIWTREYVSRPGVLKSQIYYEIFKKFKENGVEIPLPQREIHIKDSSTSIKDSI